MRPAYAWFTVTPLSPTATPASDRTPALSTSMRTTRPFASMTDTPRGAPAGRTYVHSAPAGGVGKSPAARRNSSTVMPTRIRPMPDGVTTHPRAGAPAGVADPVSAGGGAAAAVALLSAVFFRLSAVLALRIRAASVNGGIVRTLLLSGWNGP